MRSGARGHPRENRRHVRMISGTTGFKILLSLQKLYAQQIPLTLQALSYKIVQYHAILQHYPAPWTGTGKLMTHYSWPVNEDAAPASGPLPQGRVRGKGNL